MVDDKKIEFGQQYIKEIYFDATTTIRHYDGVRSSFTQIYGSLVAIFTTTSSYFAKSLDGPYFFLGSAVSLSMSVLGLFIILKINSLLRLQRRRASIAMSQLEENIGISTFFSINNRAKSSQNDDITNKISLSVLWCGIFAVLIAINFLLLIIGIFRLDAS